jgi:hypothetical protein
MSKSINKKDSSGIFGNFFAKLKGSHSKKAEEIEKANDYLNAYLNIDFPTEGEIVSGLHYAIRIGASNDGFVEISFNEGEWNPCRFSGGFWWFDWGYFKPGDYVIKARLVSVDGDTVILIKERNCKVC